MNAANAYLDTLLRALDQAPDAIVLMDRRGRVVYANRAVEEHTGVSRRAVEGRNARVLWRRVADPKGLISLISSLRAARAHRAVVTDVAGKPLELVITPVFGPGGATTHLLASARRVTPGTAAFYDPVTGLPTMALFAERVPPILAMARREMRTLALFRFEIDGPGAESNEALAAVGERLQLALRDSDILAREPEAPVVSALLQEIPPGPVVGRVAARVLEQLRPLCSARVGIALFPRDASGIDELIQHADLALQRARERGSAFEFYRAELNVVTEERLRMEQYLRIASKSNSFLLHYQPVVDIETGKLVGAEALTRGHIVGVESLAEWLQHEDGIVPPSEFLETAEASGSILALDRWAIAAALRQASVWWRDGWRGWISVNLSVRSLRDPLISEYVGRVLRSHDVAPGHLVLEVTEAAATRDPTETAQLLSALKAQGVKLALDDFGTGHASTSYLRDVEVDFIKLDQNFVREIGTNREEEWLVERTVAMAHSMGALVVAEGVEQPAQMRWLKTLGCDLVQGYLVGRPGPPEALDTFR